MNKPCKVGLRVLTDNLKYSLKHEAAELFDKLPFRRTAPGSPHIEMTDIWARYKNIMPNLESGDFSDISDEHDSIWYPHARKLKDIKKICADIMHHVQGTRLGGVLITKLPPGGKIAWHTDSNWHANYYDKFWVPIQNAHGAVMKFSGLPDDPWDEITIDPYEGDVHWFNNSYPHAVFNNSDKDRIGMIVCIRIEGERQW